MSLKVRRPSVLFFMSGLPAGCPGDKSLESFEASPELSTREQRSVA